MRSAPSSPCQTDEIGGVEMKSSPCQTDETDEIGGVEMKEMRAFSATSIPDVPTCHTWSLIV